MYASERLLDELTAEEIYYTLKSLIDEDCYLSEFTDNSILENFLYLLEMYDIVFVASDDRVLLTPKGQNLLQNVAQLVETNLFHNKITKKKKL